MGSTTGTTDRTRGPALITAPCAVFTDAAASGAWQAPGEMTGKVHELDARLGSGYRMPLYLRPPSSIVQRVTFDADELVFAGAMTMVVMFEEREERALVTIAYHGLPPGIRPEDNDLGTRLSLQKLAGYVESLTGEQSRRSRQ